MGLKMGWKQWKKRFKSSMDEDIWIYLSSCTEVVFFMYFLPVPWIAPIQVPVIWVSWISSRIISRFRLRGCNSSHTILWGCSLCWWLIGCDDVPWSCTDWFFHNNSTTTEIVYPFSYGWNTWWILIKFDTILQKKFGLKNYGKKKIVVIDFFKNELSLR